jgi:hypothetical protein
MEIVSVPRSPPVGLLTVLSASSKVSTPSPSLAAADRRAFTRRSCLAPTGNDSCMAEPDQTVCFDDIREPTHMLPEQSKLTAATCPCATSGWSLRIFCSSTLTMPRHLRYKQQRVVVHHTQPWKAAVDVNSATGHDPARQSRHALVEPDPGRVATDLRSKRVGDGRSMQKSHQPQMAATVSLQHAMPTSSRTSSQLSCAGTGQNSMLFWVHEHAPSWTSALFVLQRGGGIKETQRLRNARK